MTKNNPFTDLLDNLNSGKLGHNQIQSAYRAWINQRGDIPDNIKNLLCNETSPISSAFSIIGLIIGNMELAYRRGYSAGLEDAKKHE